MTARLLHSVVLGCAVLSLTACVSRDSGGQSTDGQVVADRLNARYLNIVDDCAGQPAYLCSGVAVRVLDPFNSDLQPLDPTPTQIARNGASFSFARRDLGVRRLYQMGWAGYVVGLQEASGFVPLRARCAFPVDAYTDSRPDSCGYSRFDMSPTLQSRPCAEQGINSPQAWGSYFATIADQRFSCSFDSDTKGFLHSMQSRPFIPEDSPRHDQWNELIIAIWSQEEVSRLPVEAVFYYPVDGVPFWRVQQHQCRIYFATGRRVPLLKLDLTGREDAVFSFDQADQIDFETVAPDCDHLSDAAAAIAPAKQFPG